jgi:hypothetical protein
MLFQFQSLGRLAGAPKAPSGGDETNLQSLWGHFCLLSILCTNHLFGKSFDGWSIREVWAMSIRLASTEMLSALSFLA